MLEDIEGFDWDEGNIDKNQIKLSVSISECEELFFNLPLILADDPKHSQTEKRYYVLGQSNANRRFFIAFTVQNHKIRVISARDMNPKEEKTYDQTHS